MTETPDVRPYITLYSDGTWEFADLEIPEPEPMPGGDPWAEAFNAGCPAELLDTLTPSGSIIVSTAGAIIEDLDVTGTITVTANNVTIRNSRVIGGPRPIYVRSGITGLLVEFVTIHMPDEAGGGGAGVSGGGNNTVRYVLVTGRGDGLKAHSGSDYEFNRIRVSKPSGASDHIDGIQGSGSSNYTIRGNYVDVPISTGQDGRVGNQGILIQASTGSNNKLVHDVVVEGNYFDGGGITVQVKPDGEFENVRFSGNTVGDNHEFTYLRGMDAPGVTWDDTNTLIGA